MTKEVLKLKKLIEIKDINGCTNFGGISLAPKSSKLYAIKTKQDNSVSTIITYKDYQNPDSPLKGRKYTGKLGHGNGLAYGVGTLLVPPCDSFIGAIDVKTGTFYRYDSDRPISAVAHKGRHGWIVKSKDKLHRITLDHAYNRVVFGPGYTIDNPMAGEGFTVSQDIAYKGGMIYHVFSHGSKKQNCILVSRWPTSAKVGLKVEKVYISEKKDQLYEWESLAITKDGDFLIAVNSKGGDFIGITKNGEC